MTISNRKKTNLNTGISLDNYVINFNDGHLIMNSLTLPMCFGLRCTHTDALLNYNCSYLYVGVHDTMIHASSLKVAIVP